MTPDSSFSNSATSLHLIYVFWMHPLMLNQQDQEQTSAVRNNEGTRRSLQIEGSYVASWFKVLNGTFISINYNRMVFSWVITVGFSWHHFSLSDCRTYWVSWIWMFLKHWKIKDILHIIFLASLHLVFFSYRKRPCFLIIQLRNTEF